jgi:hypothetical protein
MTQKKCRHCKLPLSINEFHPHKRMNDGLNSWCKKCSAASVKRTRDKNVRCNRMRIRQLKRKPCMDCGNTFPPECMDYDHRDPATKSREVGNMIYSTWSWAKIQAEIDKCDLLCSNCHRIRTYVKQGTLKEQR